MGNAQDPSAPPSPYQPPPQPGLDLNALSPPINTPGLPVPGVDPASIGPPAPAPMVQTPAPPPGPDVGTPPALAMNTPQQGGSAPPVQLDAPTQQPAPTGYTTPSPFGGSPVAEAQNRARSDAAENKDLAKQYGQAVVQEKLAQNAMSQVQQNEASDLAVNIAEQRAQVAQIQATGAQSQAAYDKTVAARQTDWDNAVQAQKNMVFDPDKYVNSMSVGSKILTSIAIGLSAIGSSRSIGGSGENMALKMFNDSIQGSVDAQKEQYRRLGNQIDLAQNAYARARQSKMDDQQATLAAKQSAIDDHSMAAKVITARYDPSRIDANRQMILAHLDTLSTQTKQEFAKTAHAEASRAASDVFQAQQGVFNMGVQAENLRMNEQQNEWQHQDRQSALAEKAMAAEAKATGHGGGVPAGWVGEAPVTNEQKNKAAELSGTERILTRKLGEMLQFKQDYGNEALNRSEIAKVKSTAAQVKVALKDKFGLGVMSDSDSELLDNVARDPSKVSWSPATQAQLQHLIEQVHADTDDQMEGYGLRRDSEYKARKSIPFKEAEGGK